MMSVSKKDIISSLGALGIKKGDVVLLHSSFKSLGEVDGGAETVISGFLDSVGDEGTLVLPTFTQKDFENAYKTWHLDKHSDTGYLTNYFRKRAGSLRSNQATHSVAASGRLARELTITHGESGKRFGEFGDTPFSADSPWEKMYNSDAAIVLLGVDPLSVTFRHYAEYLYIERCLNSLSGHAEYDEMKSELSDFCSWGVWPHLYSIELARRLEDKGKLKRAKCGNAELICISSRDFVDLALDAMQSYDEGVLRCDDEFWLKNKNTWLEWSDKFRKITEA